MRIVSQQQNRMVFICRVPLIKHGVSTIACLCAPCMARFAPSGTHHADNDVRVRAANHSTVPTRAAVRRISPLFLTDALLYLCGVQAAKDRRDRLRMEQVELTAKKYNLANGQKLGGDEDKRDEDKR
jgi:hypothetical protein